MPNVQIREVSDDVHSALVRKAELAGQSLQQFLSAELTRLASVPTVEEVMAQIEARPKGRLSGSGALKALQDERARR